MEKLSDLIQQVQADINPHTSDGQAKAEIKKQSTELSGSNRELPSVGMTMASLTDSRPLTDADDDWARKEVSDAYGLNAYDPTTPAHGVMTAIYEQAVRSGMTSAEYRQRCDALTSTCVFAAFTKAEFLKKELIPRLYPRAWYLEQIDADRTAGDRIGAYRLPDGRTGYGYREEIGDAFDDAAARTWSDVLQGKEKVKQLPHNPDPIPAPAQTILDLQKRNALLSDQLAAEKHLHAQAVQMKRAAERERDTAREERDECRDVAAQLHEIAHGVISGRMTTDEGRAAMEAMASGEEVTA